MKTKKSSRTAQLTLDDARKPTGRGGWRPNAGRPKGRRNVPHERREDFPTGIPLHVTLRIVDGVESLRRGEIVKVIWGAIASAHDDTFRVVHFNVEPDHLHLITEAQNRIAHSAGMQGLDISLVKRLNKKLGRSGSLFDERFHSRPLRTPREVRNALRYVLNNARHHAHERGEILDPTWIDPYSSAIWFDGWRDPIAIDAPWKRDLLAMTPPTAKPTAWLLETGWRRHGLIAFDEVPGPKSRKKRS